MRSLVISLALLVLAGCVTPGQRKDSFNQELNRFVGLNADDLVVAKGPPSSSFALSSGGRVFEYSKSKTVTSGGGSHTVMHSVYVPGNSGGGGTWVSAPMQQANPVYSVEHSCKILFKLSATNIVESWTYEGNGCY